MRRSFWFAPTVLGLVLSTVARGEPESNAGAVVAAVESTMSTGSGQLRQLAFDGDAATFFASDARPGADEHFTLVFDRPVRLNSVVALTGRPDGADTLDAGALEVSADGKAFESVATFSAGEARAAPKRDVQAVRVRPPAGMNHRLVVRELTVDSDPPVARFAHPVEFVVDVADAPEMKGWAENAARLCERWYPRIIDALKTAGPIPPRRITLRISNDYRGVAEAGGGRITGSARFFKDHPDDVGAMIHETTHVVQNYRHSGNPGWLVEGVADHVRFFVFEPGKIGPLDARRAHYDASYRVTAAFLAFVTDHHDKELVPKLNAIMTEGTYRDSVFKDLTGKSVEELDEEWRASLRR